MNRNSSMAFGWANPILKLNLKKLGARKMTTNDPASERLKRAQKLRAQIKEVTSGGKKEKSTTVPTRDPEVCPPQSKSLNEIMEERMRDHVGEKKP
jgi:hypothetical protein